MFNRQITAACNIMYLAAVISHNFVHSLNEICFNDNFYGTFIYRLAAMPATSYPGLYLRRDK